MATTVIQDFPNYTVDSRGTVRNLDGLAVFQEITESGYLRVQLFRNGRKKNLRVHRLVLEAFRGKCPDRMEARHLDGDKRNNRLSNLVWGTPADNHEDSVRLGLNRPVRLTNALVRKIRKYTRSKRYWADKLGVSVWTVKKARSGKIWRHVG